MGFREELCEESLDALAIRDAIAVRPLTLVRAAIAAMRSQALGCVVIVNNDYAPIGIFSEQSVIQLLLGGAPLDETPVSEFADPNFLSLPITAPISAAWDAIQNEGVRFICVTDTSGRLIGLTGQRGIAEHVSDCFAGQVAVQRLGSQPWMCAREGA